MDEIDEGVLYKNVHYQLAENKSKDMKAPEHVIEAWKDLIAFVEKHLESGELKPSDFGRRPGQIGGEAELTSRGRKKVEALLPQLFDRVLTPEEVQKELQRVNLVAAGIWVHTKNVDYVDFDGAKLLDGVTDEVLYDPLTSSESRWQDGRAQVIEIMNGMTVRADTESSVKITLPEILRKDVYTTIVGASGTAKGKETIFEKLGLSSKIVEIPRYYESQLKMLPDHIFKTQSEALIAWADHAAEVHRATGQPQLLVTHRNDIPAKVVPLLEARGVPHMMVDAHWQLSQGTRLAEAFEEVKRKAGEARAVLIINRQGGRGMDIKTSDEAEALGGLSGRGTAHSHISPDIDVQQENRVARSGNKGDWGYFSSLEDELYALTRRDNTPITVTKYVTRDEYDKAAAAYESRKTPLTRRELADAEQALRDIVKPLQAESAKRMGIRMDVTEDVPSPRPTGSITPTGVLNSENRGQVDRMETIPEEADPWVAGELQDGALHTEDGLWFASPFDTQADMATAAKLKPQDSDEQVIRVVPTADGEAFAVRDGLPFEIPYSPEMFADRVRSHPGFDPDRRVVLPVDVAALGWLPPVFNQLAEALGNATVWPIGQERAQPVNMPLSAVDRPLANPGRPVDLMETIPEEDESADLAPASSSRGDQGEVAEDVSGTAVGHDQQPDDPAIVLDPGPGERGTWLDPERGVRAVHETNPGAKPKAMAWVRPREFTPDEIRGIHDALEHYAPIVGEERASSSRAHAEQEVRYFGAVSFGVEDGEIAPDARAEYLASHQVINLYSTGTITKEFGGGHRGIEGTVTHELAHGLLSYALEDYGRHVDSWNDDGTPKRTADAEPPIDPKVGDDAGDFKAALKTHLLKAHLSDAGRLATRAPRRAEFVSRLEQEHSDVFIRRDRELSGQAADRIFTELKDRQSEFNEHTGYWHADGFPAFAGERPISRYGATNLQEDMAETAKYYFLDPDTLRRKAPRRAAFFDKLVAGWAAAQPVESSNNEDIDKVDMSPNSSHPDETSVDGASTVDTVRENYSSAADLLTDLTASAREVEAVSGAPVLFESRDVPLPRKVLSGDEEYSWDKASTLAFAKFVAQELADGLFDADRPGELKTIELNKAVVNHPDPAYIWDAVIEFLAWDPRLAPMVKYLTYGRVVDGEHVVALLPDHALELLDGDNEPHVHEGDDRVMVTLSAPLDSPRLRGGGVKSGDFDPEWAKEMIARFLENAGNGDPSATGKGKDKEKELVAGSDNNGTGKSDGGAPAGRGIATQIPTYARDNEGTGPTRQMSRAVNVDIRPGVIEAVPRLAGDPLLDVIQAQLDWNILSFRAKDESEGRAFTLIADGKSMELVVQANFRWDDDSVIVDNTATDLEMLDDASKVDAGYESAMQRFRNGSIPLAAALTAYPPMVVAGSLQVPVATNVKSTTAITNSAGRAAGVEVKAMRQMNVPVEVRWSLVDAKDRPVGRIDDPEKPSGHLVDRSVTGNVNLSVPVTFKQFSAPPDDQLPDLARKPAKTLWPEEMILRPEGSSFYEQMTEGLPSHLTEVGAEGRILLKNFFTDPSIKAKLLERAAFGAEPNPDQGWVPTGDLLKGASSKSRSRETTRFEVRLVAYKGQSIELLKNVTATDTTFTENSLSRTGIANRPAGFTATVGGGANVGVSFASAGPAAGLSRKKEKQQQHNTGTTAEQSVEIVGDIDRRFTRYAVQVRRLGHKEPMTLKGHVDAFQWAIPDLTSVSPARADRKYYAPFESHHGLAGAVISNEEELLKVYRVVVDLLRDVPGRRWYHLRSKMFIRGLNDDAFLKGLRNALKGLGLRRSSAEALLRDAKAREALSKLSDLMFSPDGAKVTFEGTGLFRNHYTVVTLRASMSNVKDLGPVTVSKTTAVGKITQTEGVKFVDSQSASASLGIQVRAQGPLGPATGTLIGDVGYKRSRSRANKMGSEHESTTERRHGDTLKVDGSLGSRAWWEFSGDVTITPEIRSYHETTTAGMRLSIGSWGKSVPKLVPRADGDQPAPQTLPLRLAVPKVLITKDKPQPHAVAPENFKTIESPRPIDELRGGLSRMYDSLDILAIGGTEHLRASYRRMAHKSSQDPIFEWNDEADREAFVDAHISELIDHYLSPDNLRTNGRVFSGPISFSGLHKPRRWADLDLAGHVLLTPERPRPLSSTEYQKIERETGNTTLVGKSTGSGNSFATSVFGVAGVRGEVSSTNSQSTARSLGVFIATLAPWNFGWGKHKSSRLETVQRITFQDAKPVRQTLVRVDVRAEVMAETRYTRNFDPLRLLGRKYNTAGESFTLPDAVLMWVTDEQLAELRDGPRAAPAQQRPDKMLPPPQSLIRGKGVSIGLGGITTTIDLAGRITNLRRLMLDKLTADLNEKEAKKALDLLLPKTALDIEHNNYGEMKRFLENVHRSENTVNGGQITPLRLEGRFSGRTYYLTIGAKFVGEPVFSGIEHVSSMAVSREVSLTNSEDDFTHRTLAALGTSVRPAGRFTEKADHADGQQARRHGATDGVYAGGVAGDATIGVKNRKQGYSTEKFYKQSLETSGPVATYTGTLAFDIKIERGLGLDQDGNVVARDLVAHDDEARETVTIQKLADETFPEPGGGRKRFGEAGPIRMRHIKGDEDAVAWRNAPGYLALPEIGSFAIEHYFGDVADLRRALAKAIAVASGGTVRPATIASMETGLTLPTVEAGTPWMTQGEFTFPLPAGLGYDVEIHARVKSESQLVSASAAVTIEGSQGTVDTPIAELKTGSGFTASGVPASGGAGVAHPPGEGPSSTQPPGTDTAQPGAPASADPTRQNFGSMYGNSRFQVEGGVKDRTVESKGSAPENKAETPQPAEFEEPDPGVTQANLHTVEFLFVPRRKERPPYLGEKGGATVLRKKSVAAAAGVLATELTVHEGLVIRREQDPESPLPAALITAVTRRERAGKAWSAAAVKAAATKATVTAKRAAAKAEAAWWTARKDYDDQIIVAREQLLPDSLRRERQIRDFRRREQDRRVNEALERSAFGPASQGANVRAGAFVIGRKNAGVGYWSVGAADLGGVFEGLNEDEAARLWTSAVRVVEDKFDVSRAVKGLGSRAVVADHAAVVGLSKADKQIREVTLRAAGALKELWTPRVSDVPPAAALAVAGSVVKAWALMRGIEDKGGLRGGADTDSPLSRRLAEFRPTEEVPTMGVLFNQPEWEAEIARVAEQRGVSELEVKQDLVKVWAVDLRERIDPSTKVVYTAYDVAELIGILAPGQDPVSEEDVRDWWREAGPWPVPLMPDPPQWLLDYKWSKEYPTLKDWILAHEDPGSGILMPHSPGEKLNQVTVAAIRAWALLQIDEKDPAMGFERPHSTRSVARLTGLIGDSAVARWFKEFREAQAKKEAKEVKEAEANARGVEVPLPDEVRRFRASGKLSTLADFLNQPEWVAAIAQAAKDWGLPKEEVKKDWGRQWSLQFYGRLNIPVGDIYTSAEISRMLGNIMPQGNRPDPVTVQKWLKASGPRPEPDLPAPPEWLMKWERSDAVPTIEELIRQRPNLEPGIAIPSNTKVHMTLVTSEAVRAKALLLFKERDPKTRKKVYTQQDVIGLVGKLAGTALVRKWKEEADAEERAEAEAKEKAEAGEGSQGKSHSGKGRGKRSSVDLSGPRTKRQMAKAKAGGVGSSGSVVVSSRPKRVDDDVVLVGVRRPRAELAARMDDEFLWRDAGDPAGRVYWRFAGPDGGVHPDVRRRVGEIKARWTGGRGVVTGYAEAGVRLPGWMLVPEEDEDSEYEGAGKAKGKGKRRKKYQPVLESWVEERLVAEVVAEVRRTTLGEKPLVRRVRVGELTSEHVDTDEKVLVGQDGLFLEIDPEDISREEWPSLSNGRILGLYFGAVLDNDEAKAAWAAKYPLGGQGPQYPHYSVQVSKDGTRMAAEGPANSLAAANTKLDGRKIDEDEINAIFLQFDVWMPDKDGGGRWMPVAAQVALDDAFDVARNPHRKVLVHYGHTYAAENFQDVIKTEPDDAVRIESDDDTEPASRVGLRGGGLSGDTLGPGPGLGRVLPEEWLEQLGTAVREIEWPSDAVADYWREIARGELGFTEPRIPLHDPAAARARIELQRAMVEQVAHDLYHIDHELDENPAALEPVQNKIDDYRDLLDTLEELLQGMAEADFEALRAAFDPAGERGVSWSALDSVFAGAMATAVAARWSAGLVDVGGVFDGLSEDQAVRLWKRAVDVVRVQFDVSEEVKSLENRATMADHPAVIRLSPADKQIRELTLRVAGALREMWSPGPDDIPANALAIAESVNETWGHGQGIEDKIVLRGGDRAAIELPEELKNYIPTEDEPTLSFKLEQQSWVEEIRRVAAQQRATAQHDVSESAIKKEWVRSWAVQFRAKINLSKSNPHAVYGDPFTAQQVATMIGPWSGKNPPVHSTVLLWWRSAGPPPALVLPDLPPWLMRWEPSIEEPNLKATILAMEEPGPGISVVKSIKEKKLNTVTMAAVRAWALHWANKRDPVTQERKYGSRALARMSGGLVEYATLARWYRAEGIVDPDGEVEEAEESVALTEDDVAILLPDGLKSYMPSVEAPTLAVRFTQSPWAEEIELAAVKSAKSSLKVKLKWARSWAMQFYRKINLPAGDVYTAAEVARMIGKLNSSGDKSEDVSARTVESWWYNSGTKSKVKMPDPPAWMMEFKPNEALSLHGAIIAKEEEREKGEGPGPGPGISVVRKSKNKLNPVTFAAVEAWAFHWLREKDPVTQKPLYTAAQLERWSGGLILPGTLAKRRKIVESGSGVKRVSAGLGGPLTKRQMLEARGRGAGSSGGVGSSGSVSSRPKRVDDDVVLVGVRRPRAELAARMDDEFLWRDAGDPAGRVYWRFAGPDGGVHPDVRRRVGEIKARWTGGGVW
ncbi:hypothetical protein [Amycolatopsis sp. EV170708-02-1]|uniref:hypothetical protein n=1 Tax=Amycolatopsis sp. EV170708-02-1 TaxID=2919322 RepID=UPI001F0C33CD|nr:hypothetical protein [Amycolatopsis sp. EV170708-02-1]UMP06963.1 hypothetical protein MJQ72_20060 [Amycolatopsis sp. EV170708-02-1]